jgi:hypothetical protein
MRWVIVTIALIGVLAALACGGGSKPPLVPDDPNAPHPELEVDGGSSEAGW